MVVRYLTGDPPPLADRASRVIDHVDGLLLTDVALVETAYVLVSVYRIARAVVVDKLIEFVQKRNVGVPGLDKALVVQALLQCRPSGRVSFADALVWAAARCSGPQRVYTFDERFPADGIEVRSEPPQPPTPA